MKNILIATDLTNHSKNAFKRALQLARISGAKLDILHITFLPLISGVENETRTIHANLWKDIDALVRKHPGAQEIKYEIHIANRGRIYDRIDEYARKLAVDLVVTGRGEQSESAAPFAFSTIERVVAQASHPVLVAGNDVVGTYRRALITTDISHGLGKFLQVVRDFGTSLKVVFLLKSGRFSMVTGIGFIARLYERIQRVRFRRFIRFAASDLGRPEAEISCRRVKGFSAKVLAEQTTGEGADVMVMERKLTPPKGAGDDKNIRAALYALPCDILFVGRP